MKRIIALLLVLFLFGNFISCTRDKTSQEETKSIGFTPAGYYKYKYSDNIDAFIDTWRREYTEDDNFFLVEGKNYSDILIVPRIEGYRIFYATLSHDRSNYSFSLKNDGDGSYVRITVEREPETLEDYSQRNKEIAESPFVFDDMCYVPGSCYINSHGLIIEVNLTCSFKPQTKEELLEFLNLEVMYPYDNFVPDITSYKK